MVPQKVKNDPKIKSKSKVRIEENVENKTYSTTYLDPRNQKDPLIRSRTKVIIERTIENNS